METLAVYLFVILTVMGSVMVAFMRHTLHAIIGLGICLFGVAGLFLSLGSPFVAAMQVLIYIGGISVAMVFAMMLSTSMAQAPQLNLKKSAAAIVCAAVLFAGSGYVLINATFNVRAEPAPEEAWAVENIGHGFLQQYNVVFEALSLILLLAIIGAVLIAKRETAKK